MAEIKKGSYVYHRTREVYGTVTKARPDRSGQIEIESKKDGLRVLVFPHNLDVIGLICAVCGEKSDPDDYLCHRCRNG